jgi:putative ABC transport system permease protein
MTARASRRAVEVGVRKTAGAQRLDLVFQFIGETLIYVALAMLAGLSLAEVFLPSTDAFLQRTLHLDYASDPALWLAVPALTLLVGVAAGLYPAAFLSAFRPASVLKGGPASLGGSAWARQLLIVVQFGVMIALIIAATTIYRQTTFALKNRLELNTEGVVSIFTPCSEAFKQQALALPGVASVACTSSIAMNRRAAPAPASRSGGLTSVVQAAPVDVGSFELHGLKPVAGRFFAKGQGMDTALAGPNPSSQIQPNVVLNETAVRRLGFASPEAAIGQTVTWTRRDTSGPAGRPTPAHASLIVGVVPDFTMGSIRRPIDAALYYIDPKLLLFTEVRLNGRDTLQTLAALDAAVKRAGRGGPVQRSFESQSLRALYKDVIAQAAVIAVCASLAVLIAGLGMFALSAFTAERRTKEIGVRRVMGASEGDALHLMVWAFTKPVLWASLAAWPLGWWAMDRWLQGFAYRVDLPVWSFPAATLAALLIAWITVATHAILAARARPVTALRYE